MSLLSKVVNLTDSLRLAEPGGAPQAWYKEWYHFCILSPEIEAIVNFSVMQDNRPAAPPGSRIARIILLTHHQSWDGDVEEIPAREVRLNRGRIQLQFGHNTLSFQQGVFRLSVALSMRPITLELELRPATYPILRSRARIGAGKIDWLVLPHLQATGRIVVDRKVYQLENVPAYHDHNWGHWLWGQDFAWEWGFVLPFQGQADWSLVFDRMSNRGRTQVDELKLSVWKADRLRRIFVHHHLNVRPDGYLAPNRVDKFPRIMALIAPEKTTDVPKIMHIEAASGNDHLTWQFEAESLAQIVIPNETDLRETTINEVLGMMNVSGEIQGEPFDLIGKGFFEYLT